MSSEMERALDEILSGVNDLLKKVPADLGDGSQGKSRGHEGQGAVNMQVVTCVDDEPRRMHPLLQDSTVALLAAIESDLESPLAPAAARLLNELLSARMVGLSDSIDPDGLLTVSPCLVRPIDNLVSLGAVLDRYDAGYLYGDSSACQPEQIRLILGRYSPLFCPEQNAYRHRFRMPRMPERSVLRWRNRNEINPIAGFEDEFRVALVDQDNDGDVRSTMIWFSGHRFVPDQWCGLSFHEGQWRPVTHAGA